MSALSPRDLVVLVLAAEFIYLGWSKKEREMFFGSNPRIKLERSNPMLLAESSDKPDGRLPAGMSRTTVAGSDPCPPAVLGTIRAHTALLGHDSRLGGLALRV
ncbi:hypothetical protein M441DRAFT_52977 [Trichoderma asperellum CBS 433.97]|uniref:Uncharacterized protein n=1 Tax=Trichoderma asperellum (strain ATCC 204424 / CBS 433.97 / NBRC 101777) TaxID=1042311 RepID=A0A2T3ZN42_TRIA4|nr:hypothetical protein M441DRAFT_52977 [Trichoderma asperellum CBS 433.97]PTB46219.1 hypothetical protein M441DRAFT_52977 [Trichoderma asperellum CBS 433.97]